MQDFCNSQHNLLNTLYVSVIVILETPQTETDKRQKQKERKR